jgi:hypothetical protein
MDRAASALAKKRWAKAERVNKICLHCGRTYRGLAEQRYCSAKHQNAAAAQRLREKRRAGAEPAAPGPRPATAVRSPAEDLAHALAQAERARADDDLAGAERWEQIAARIAAAVAAECASQEDRSWELTQDLSTTPF